MIKFIVILRPWKMSFRYASSKDRLIIDYDIK
jgi:hypothetical protein